MSLFTAVALCFTVICIIVLASALINGTSRPIMVFLLLIAMLGSFFAAIVSNILR